MRVNRQARIGEGYKTGEQVGYGRGALVSDDDEQQTADQEQTPATPQASAGRRSLLWWAEQVASLENNAIAAALAALFSGASVAAFFAVPDAATLTLNDNITFDSTTISTAVVSTGVFIGILLLSIFVEGRKPVEETLQKKELELAGLKSMRLLADEVRDLLLRDPLAVALDKAIIAGESLELEWETEERAGEPVTSCTATYKGLRCRGGDLQLPVMWNFSEPTAQKPTLQPTVTKIKATPVGEVDVLKLDPALEQGVSHYRGRIHLTKPGVRDGQSCSMSCKVYSETSGCFELTSSGMEQRWGLAEARTDELQYRLWGFWKTLTVRLRWPKTFEGKHPRVFIEPLCQPKRPINNHGGALRPKLSGDEIVWEMELTQVSPQTYLYIEWEFSPSGRP